jgi:tetratricopeptide (TPR) repeat protein
MVQAAGSGPEVIDDLLLLAVGRPHEALARARAVLAGHPGDYAASVAHQAAGIVARDHGDAAAGVRELRAALRLARRTGSTERETDVLATLGAALVLAGRTAAGLAAFGQALRQSSGVLTGQVLHRRAMMLWTLGRHAEALDDLRRAVGALRRAGHPVWMARVLTARGLVYTRLGFPGRADTDFVAAERLLAETSQDVESVYPVHNRAMSAFAAGDLLAALSCLDEAAGRYRLLDAPNPALNIDRCTVLLAAGLAGDALAEADAAIAEIEQRHGRSTWKAELLLTAARCALAAGRPQAAVDWAQAACRLFRSQQSTWWQAHAAGVLVQAKYATGLASAGLLGEAGRAARSLEAAGSSEVARAHLLAGRVALKLGRPDEARRHFTTAARSRHRGPAWSRACGWLSEALRAELDGDLSRMYSACRRGLNVLDEHRFTLGASELRAQTTAHGSELAALAQRHAAQAHRPRLLLAWSERWRATALAVPTVRPVGNEELATGLAAFRAAAWRLEEVTRQAAATPSTQREQRRLEREQQQLERAVRACALRTQSVANQGPAAVRIPDLLDELGSAQLLEIVDVDGVLHVLVCGNGRVRQFTAGRAADASRAAGFAGFALSRLARSRPGGEVDSALAILKSAGPKLQDALLGPACRHLGDGPVIIVPPGKLHAVPWALIPELHGRVISVAPSASAWLRARVTSPPARRHVVLARGPGLPTNGAEIPAVTGLYDDTTVLTDGKATTEKVLHALDGAWLAHIAAHGIFRADSPLFSSLRMADGPLTAYDFERLRSAPYRLVLPSCESGALAPAGADELLGLVASLLPLGTAGIIAAIGPLNDNAVVPVMLDLHRHLRNGQTLAESVRAVRRTTTGDPVRSATALSLVALGAA